MNYLDITNAIAAQFAGLTAGDESLPATGLDGLLVNATGGGPILVVYPPTGELSIGIQKRVEDVLRFSVMLLRDPADVPTRHRQILAWADAMRLRVEQKMTLNLAYVAWAKAVLLRVALDGQRYGDVVNDVVEIVIEVRINEIHPEINV